jgi:hypothetical protein
MTCWRRLRDCRRRVLAAAPRSLSGGRQDRLEARLAGGAGPKGGEETGRNPPPGKPGAQRHLITDRNGPLALLSPANRPMMVVRGALERCPGPQAGRARSGPPAAATKGYGDKSAAAAAPRIKQRIARKGVGGRPVGATAGSWADARLVTASAGSRSVRAPRRL